MTAYVCGLEIRLHVAESNSLKSKRQVVRSLKDLIRRRFGAAVAEIDGHDTWQSATLLCAVVGGSDVASRVDELERFVEARCPGGCNFSRETLSLADLRD